MPIVIGALIRVTRGLIKGLEDLEIRGWAETIQTKALLRSARILRKVLETCCHSDFSGKSSANADGKNSLKSKIIIITMLKALHQREENYSHSIERCVDPSIRRLEDCIKESKERLITTTRNSTNNTKINRIAITIQRSTE